MLMSETVIFFVERPIVNAEGTGKIEHHAASGKELRRQVVTHFMRGGEKHHVHASAEFADIGHRLQRHIDNAFELRMQVGN